MSHSLAKKIALLPALERQAWVDSLTDTVRAELALEPWWFIGRPEQLEPEGDWLTWVVMTGRNWGKTRTGAETLLTWALENPVDATGAPTHWGIFATTFHKAREVCLEGPSGLLRVLALHGVPYTYDKSKYQITLAQGQVIHLSGAQDEDIGRGYNLSGAWCDECGEWPKAKRTWTDGIRLAVRVPLPGGRSPRVIITTTPKPAHPLLTYLLAQPTTRHTSGSIDENADNTDPAVLAEYHALYDDTRLGRQELEGILLSDVEGALWHEGMIPHEPAPMDYERVVIAIDPAITNTPDSDETGIVVAGKCQDGRLAVIADYSCRDTPMGWAKRVVEAYNLHGASLVLYEPTQGGAAWPTILHSIDPFLPVKETPKGVRNVNKRTRAEPVATWYETGKVFHVQQFDRQGREVRHLARLEDQMTGWDARDTAKSPDRLDAMVYALTELTGRLARSNSLRAMVAMCPHCDTPNPPGSVACSACGKLIAETGEAATSINLWGKVGVGPRG